MLRMLPELSTASPEDASSPKALACTCEACIERRYADSFHFYMTLFILYTSY